MLKQHDVKLVTLIVIFIIFYIIDKYAASFVSIQYVQNSWYVAEYAASKSCLLNELLVNFNSFCM